MKSLAKVIVGVIFALGLVIAPQAAPVYAENEDLKATSEQDESSWIKVTPASSKVILLPGSELDYAIIVENNGSKDYNFNVYAAPYTITSEEYDLNFTDETNYSQIVHWIKFINDDGSLVDTYTGSIPAGSKKTVSYRIITPQDVPAGGQYATIFAQTDSNDSDTDSNELKTISRVGSIVYGRTDGETRESASITDLSVPGFLLSGPVTVKSIVKNSGNIDFSAVHKFTVKSIVGSELYHEEDSQIVFPDTSRKATFSWESTQLMGIFRVTYRVEAVDQIQEVTRLVIILPAYMLLIFIILLTIFIIWIIITIRKRRERKSRLVA